MGSSGIPFAEGVRFLLDEHRRFFRPGLEVYLRIKNFQETAQESPALDLGFSYSPTGGQSTGFTDELVDPPAHVTEVSLHDIGLNAPKLMFGARRFRISETFVAEQMRKNNLTDPYQVFRRSQVVGLLYNGRLFSIESITHEDAGGEVIEWLIIANASEVEVTAT